MKKVLLLFLLITSYSFAQETFNSTGFNISSGDLKTNICEMDSTANALLIYEYGNSYVSQKNYDLIFEYKNKTKIFNREGFDKANISILLYNSDKRKEKIRNLKATTYNLVNGKVEKTQINKKDIYEEKYNDSYTIVKFAFPNVQEGCIVSYSYEIQSPFMYNFQPWTFQSDIPTLYSEYNTSVPANFDYNIKLIGTLKLASHDKEIKRHCLEGSYGASADCTISKYTMKDIPAFKEEDYMTTKENYLSKIEYELSVFQGFDGSIHNYSKTWETADKEIKNDDLGRQLRKSSMLKGLLGDDITNDSDAFSRANKILCYVQNNYAWNEKYELFKEVSVKDLIKEKSGSATEINILLHNLLDDNGIDAKPVLISTREHGLPAKLFPVISEFNYLIVMVTIDSENYFLDATNKYLSFGEIPFRCLNQYGRLLDFENNSTWIDIAPKKISTVQMLVDVALGNNDNLIGRVKSQKSGYHALSDKEAYFSNQTSYIEKLDEKYDDLEIINHEVKDNNIINAFDFNEEFEIESNLDLSSEIIYFDPFIFKYFDENPFKLKDRTYPIDFGYKDIYSYSCSIDLKDQYEVIELPKDLNISLPKNTGKLLFSINEVDGKLQIYFKVNFNQEIYPSSYYPALKELMSSIVNCQNNSIVILKKK